MRGVILVLELLEFIDDILWRSDAITEIHLDRIAELAIVGATPGGHHRPLDTSDCGAILREIEEIVIRKWQGVKILDIFCRLMENLAIFFVTQAPDMAIVFALFNALDQVGKRIFAFARNREVHLRALKDLFGKQGDFWTAADDLSVRFLLANELHHLIGLIKGKRDHGESYHLWLEINKSLLEIREIIVLAPHIQEFDDMILLVKDRAEIG